MKTLLSKVAGAILLLSILWLALSLVMSQGPKANFIPIMNEESFFFAILIGTWALGLTTCLREKRGGVTFALSMSGTVFMVWHLWRIQKGYFKGVADILRRFIDISADTLSAGLALGVAFLMVILVHVGLRKVFLPMQVPVKRSFSQRFGLFVLGSGSIATVAILFCINHQWFGADRVIAGKLTKMVAGSESSEQVMVSSSAAHYEMPAVAQVITVTTPTATPVVAANENRVEAQPKPVVLHQALPETSEAAQTKSAATSEASTEFNEHLISRLKRFENEPLAKGDLAVSVIRTDTISGKQVLEVGFGITPDEIKELMLHDLLPQGSKLPSQLTAAQADAWLRTKTLPCYEMQVKEIVGSDVYSSLNECQRFALVSFCHNLGKAALGEVFQDPRNQLSVAGLESTCNTITRYVHSAHKERTGLVKRRYIEAGWLYSVLLDTDTKSNLLTSSAGIGSKPTAKPTTKTQASNNQKPPFLPDGSIDKALVGQIEGFEKDIMVPVTHTAPES